MDKSVLVLGSCLRGPVILRRLATIFLRPSSGLSVVVSLTLVTTALVAYSATSANAESPSITSLRVSSSSHVYAAIDRRTSRLRLINANRLRLSSSLLTSRNRSRRCNVAGKLQVTSSPAIASSPNGPTIFFARLKDSALVSLSKVRGRWTEKVVDPTARVCGVVSAARCGSGTCVSYFDERRQMVRLARSGKKWAFTNLGRVGNNAGAMNAIAANRTLTVVAYADTTAKVIRIAEIVNNRVSRSVLSYANQPIGLFPSVAIDRRNIIHLTTGFLTQPAAGTVYARKLPRETWRVGLVSGAPTSTKPSLMTHDSGKSYIGILPNKRTQIGEFVEAEVHELLPSGMWTRSTYTVPDGTQPILDLMSHDRASLSTVALRQNARSAGKQLISLEKVSINLLDPLLRALRVDQLRIAVP